MTDVHVQVPDPIVKEASSFTATAHFRVDGAASAPSTNVKYRLDNLQTGTQVKDWTDVTPAVSVTISITSAHNKILNNSNRIEKMQLTVAADRGETNATYGTVTWDIENVYGYTANT